MDARFMGRKDRIRDNIRVREAYGVVRRILEENGREHFWTYVFAIACLLAIAGATAYLAWIIRDIVDKVFYEDRKDLILLLSGSVFLAFLVRGIASYGQAVALARVGNNIIARYQRRIFDKPRFNEVAREFPDITTDRVYVDAMSLFLVQHPHKFDVMVTENMFGDILSDLAAGIVGGMGMAPSADIGPEHAWQQHLQGGSADVRNRR